MYVVREKAHAVIAMEKDYGVLKTDPAHRKPDLFFKGNWRMIYPLMFATL